MTGTELTGTEMTEPDILAALAERTTAGIKFSLEPMQRFLAAAGSPEKTYPAVLIAGTNGKGSTSAMWAAALTAAGHKVGHYTSPHLVRYAERIVVDGQMIDQTSLARGFDQLLRYEQRLSYRLTFFEATTFIALCHFAESGVDAAVLEVGMGGRLDATNVVSPVLSLITTIGLDHMEYLGPDLASIAKEKAGILRAGVPAVVGLMPDMAEAAIVEQARAVGARLTALSQVEHGDDWLRWPATASARVEQLSPALGGPHQQRNALAFVLSALVDEHFSLSESAIRAGLQAKWPGRYQTIVLASGQKVILDGAHNPDGVDALMATLRADASLIEHPRVLVYGALGGRDQNEMLAQLAPWFDQVIVAPPQTPRALTAEALRVFWPAAVVADSVAAALTLAKSQARLIVVAGSLYVVGEALAAISGRDKQAVFDFR